MGRGASQVPQLSQSSLFLALC
uniref:Uncharacterized protein n=1 Tax=Anguilla anguilla TaxID=7936 RepID=A0A0E9U3B9_ANGAN